MRPLTHESSSEAIIRTLFLAEIPQNLCHILSIWEDNDLEKLAKVSDKMLETMGSFSTFAIDSINVAAGTTVNGVTTPDSFKSITESTTARQKVDSGIVVSVMLRLLATQNIKQRDLTLYAVNGTVMHNFGSAVVNINLGPRRSFRSS